MKISILVFGFILLSSGLFGQEKSDFNILETDSTWNQEVFHFPISFAPEIKFEGFEDARFPKFWVKEDSLDFWSYVFAWSINNPVEITSSVLEHNIELYFNGLMNYENSIALFIEEKADSNSVKYVGKLNTFDALVSNKNMTLNVTAEYFYCSRNKKTTVVFRFSPKAFGTLIWDKLDNVSLRKHRNYCD